MLLLVFDLASGSCIVGVKNMSEEPPPPSNPDLNEPVCGTGILDDDYGIFFTYNSFYDSSYNSIYDSLGVMVAGSHDAFFTYNSSYNSYYDSFYISCYLYSESPPVNLVRIQMQLSEMRENKPWTDTSIIMETAQVKKRRKGKKGKGRGRPGKKKAPSTLTEPDFDPGKIFFV